MSLWNRIWNVNKDKIVPLIILSSLFILVIVSDIPDIVYQMTNSEVSYNDIIFLKENQEVSAKDLSLILIEIFILLIIRKNIAFYEEFKVMVLPSGEKIVDNDNLGRLNSVIFYPNTKNKLTVEINGLSGVVTSIKKLDDHDNSYEIDYMPDKNKHIGTIVFRTKTKESKKYKVNE